LLISKKNNYVNYVNPVQKKTKNMKEVNDLIREVIGSAYKVHNALGSGFLEKVYENAMMIELRKLGIRAMSQAPIEVFYEEVLVGNFAADILVEDCLILELKAVENILKIHETQLVNYLTATGIEDGLLINFGSSVEVKRKFRKYVRTK
jgi:GxxExxY protein